MLGPESDGCKPYLHPNCNIGGNVVSTFLGARFHRAKRVSLSTQRHPHLRRLWPGESPYFEHVAGTFRRTRKLVISVSVMRGFQCKTMRQMQKKRDKRDKIRDKWDKIKDNETKDQTVSSLSFILFHSYFLIHNVSLKRLHSIWLGYTDKFITIIHID